MKFLNRLNPRQKYIFLIITAFLFSCITPTNTKETIPEITDSYVINLLDDHLGFYCKRCSFKDFEVRKVSETIYDVAMQKGFYQADVSEGWWNRSGDPIFTWTRVIVRMTFDFENESVLYESMQGNYRFNCN